MTYLKTAFLPKLTIASALLLSACGGGGGGSSTPTPTPPPVADVTSPSVSFSPSTLSVEAGASASSTLSASDARGVTSGPNVTCTNGGVFDVASNRFTAANVTADTQSVCTATASDAAGNQGSAVLTVAMTAPIPDTSAPVLAFSPSTLTVASGAAGASSLTAVDDTAVTTGPVVACTNGGSFNVGTNIFTAATLAVGAADVQSVCTATAGDAAGNEGTTTLTVTMTAPLPDTTAPVLTFSPATLTVASGLTGASTLTVTENATATVTCTNGGSFNVTTNEFTAAAVTENTESVCTATATDEAGNEGTATLTVTMTPAAVAGVVTVSGKLTYDRVPFNSAARDGLNFDGTVRMPIRQVPVELVNAQGTVLQSTVSDDNGDYSFDVDSGLDVRVRARSEVQKTGANLVDMKVVDNTSGDALYAIQGPVSEVPVQNQTRNLHAASGWGGSSYTATRAAAPFALLDTIYATLEDFIAVDADVDFPAFNVLWSTRNRAESGSVAAGQIGTSSFTVANGVPVIRILGDENNDTDEYDVHVVVHEFGHYFENSLSRADSIGGPHSSNDRLDPRVAFGEGWGNALSGMILDDPLYRDSFGSRQSSDFSINVESNTYPGSTGWYSEGSVQSILYDLFDGANDGADSVSYGLAPIYGALTAPDYVSTDAFTTIFSFLESLENQSGVVASDVAALTDAQDINSTSEFGVGETNTGGVVDALPVYLLLQTTGREVEMCSVNDFGTFNKHGNRRYFAFNIPSAGAYRFNMERSVGAISSDPDFIIYRQGVAVGAGQSGVNNSETAVINLVAGRYVMDAHAFENVDFSGGSTPLEVCYNVSLEAQ